MKKNKPARSDLKLHLSAHTVRALVQPQLALVAGGIGQSGGTVKSSLVGANGCHGTSSDPCTQ
jgi:hypothetical protein